MDTAQKSNFSLATEAKRCLFCFDAPCQAGCPAGIDVPGFIRRISQKNSRGAFELIFRENPLPWICGILCPTEKLCASQCPRGLIDNPIRVGELQAHASEPFSATASEILSKKIPGRKVAIVGAGPAGLSAAHYLLQEGAKVTIFEAEEHPGGLITYGIPPHKIDKKRAVEEIKRLLNRPGISLNLKAHIANPVHLLSEFEAVFVAAGGGKETLEEDLSGVPNIYRAMDFLRELNAGALQDRQVRMDLGPEVIIIGGGNTAMDVAISLRLMNVPHVTVVYRRSEKEMPAWPQEKRRAREMGVHFRFLLEPAFFEKENGKVRKVVFHRTDLGECGPDGRATVVRSSGPDVTLQASAGILSTGQKAVKDWVRGVDGKVDDRTGRLGNSPIFIGGDFKSGGNLIVQAVADGKHSALEILRIINPRGQRS
jgi:glutamate synthase (NADPH/NADH) small chain